MEYEDPPSEPLQEASYSLRPSRDLSREARAETEPNANRRHMLSYYELARSELAGMFESFGNLQSELSSGCKSWHERYEAPRARGGDQKGGGMKYPVLTHPPNVIRKTLNEILLANR
jgi:hypothetical protein